ncbi:ribonuclease P protein component [Agaribacterium haliotis]|uniref:ribonuclease P protein component n=1 Tax=Agaribacterium haliotis TaxID=2013869 RepID=UPI000BB549F2|nr:ribonuclease P protein component [Agaribacterium haliotis]
MSVSSETGKQSFGKEQRLLTKSQFQYVFDQAPIRVSHPSLLILAKPNKLAHARLGLVIAKKQIKLAVRRTRIKRLIRESFRLRAEKLPPIDVIVLARSSADTLENSEVTTILNGLWKRVSKKQHKLLQQAQAQQ